MILVSRGKSHIDVEYLPIVSEGLFSSYEKAHSFWSESLLGRRLRICIMLIGILIIIILTAIKRATDLQYDA